MLDTRQEQLLRLVIEKYIATAEPIGSQFLVSESGLEVSGATIRNELRELEEEGYLTHPHTSAGRIPTEAGYRYYIEHMMKPAALDKKTAHAMGEIFADSSDAVAGLKQVGRLAAQETKNAVMIVWNRRNVYYTGISELFGQAEFRLQSFTLDVSRMFDRCEECIPELFDSAESNVTKILIGEDNPLGGGVSIVVARLPRERLFAIVGPHRMNYQQADAFITKLLEQIK